MIFELPYEGREFTSPRPQATHIKGVEFYDLAHNVPFGGAGS